MSARSDRRNAELAVIDAAIAVDRCRRGRRGDPNFIYDFENYLGDLTDAVALYAIHGLAEPSRTRTVLSAPETSHEAGEWMKRFALTDACTVFRHIYYAWYGRKFRGGLTCDEVEQALDRTHQSMSARVNELRDTGWIIDSGTRRKTRSGRAAIVWTPTQAAIDLVDRAGLPIVVTNPRKDP
jgi:hypothetical protein